MTESEEYNIAAFIEKKGAVGLLSQIDPSKGNIFSELEEQVDVASRTLSKRVNDARELDLLERAFAFEVDHGNANRYQLTFRGKKVRNQLDSVGMVEAYQNYFTAQKRLEEGEEEVKDLIADSEVTDPDWPYADPAADDLR